MKKPILLLILAIINFVNLFADSPCSSTTGNVFRRAGSRTSNIINVSLNENCAWIVNNLRPLYSAYTTRVGWVLDSVSQSPGVGSTILPLYTGTCVSAKRIIRMTAHFRDTRLTRNTSDDRFCEMNIVDTAVLIDRLNPTARTIFISTAVTHLTPSSLKHLFGPEVISDNCTPLAVLQNSIEFATSPPFPAMVSPSCDGKTRYPIRYRTKDLCGNHSNWAMANVSVVDTVLPRVVSIVGPSDLIVNTTCAATIQRSHLMVHGVDDYTASEDLIFSYRVISPASLAGNIPSTGKVLNATGLCVPDNQISVRVCAQDCFGNGDLHLSDNAVTINCNTLYIGLSDTIKPTLTESIPSQIIPVSSTTCTAEMPNLAFSVAGLDNCSDVSIYQLPAPGSFLNDGNQSVPGLARGIDRFFDCEFLKEPDNMIDCATVNGPIVKSVDVSFLIVDCYGNCTIRRFPGLVQLSKALVPTDIIISKKPFSKLTTSTGLLNYPNPFNISTQIQIEQDSECNGELSFYSIHGQLIGKKQINLARGISNITIYKDELNDYSGIVLYRLSSINPIDNKTMVRQGKMIVE